MHRQLGIRSNFFLGELFLGFRFGAEDGCIVPQHIKIEEPRRNIYEGNELAEEFGRFSLYHPNKEDYDGKQRWSDTESYYFHPFSNLLPNWRFRHFLP